MEDDVRVGGADAGQRRAPLGLRHRVGVELDDPPAELLHVGTEPARDRDAVRVVGGDDRDRLVAGRPLLLRDQPIDHVDEAGRVPDLRRAALEDVAVAVRHREVHVALERVDVERRDPRATDDRQLDVRVGDERREHGRDAVGHELAHRAGHDLGRLVLGVEQLEAQRTPAHAAAGVDLGHAELDAAHHLLAVSGRRAGDRSEHAERDRLPLAGGRRLALRGASPEEPARAADEHAAEGGGAHRSHQLPAGDPGGSPTRTFVAHRSLSDSATDATGVTAPAPYVK